MGLITASFVCFLPSDVSDAAHLVRLFPFQEETRSSFLIFDRIPYPVPRNQLRALRSRLPRCSTGDIPPAVSPTLPQGNERSVSFSPEEKPTAGGTQPPSNNMAPPDVNNDGDIGFRRDQQSGDDRAGAGDGGKTSRRPATPARTVPPVRVLEASGQTAGGAQELDRALLDDAERAGVRSKGPTVVPIEDGAVAAVEGVPADRVGGNCTSETPSTASHPSELFDSLDLSAS